MLALRGVQNARCLWNVHSCARCTTAPSQVAPGAIADCAPSTQDAAVAAVEISTIHATCCCVTQPSTTSSKPITTPTQRTAFAAAAESNTVSFTTARRSGEAEHRNY